MLKLLRQRNFSLLWFGQLISVIGDWVLVIALPFYTYSLTGSVLASGAMFIVSTLPRLALGSLAGVFVDRWDRKRTMIIADILRFLVIMLLIFFRTREWLWLVYVSAFMESAISQFFNPARSALVPLLVEEKDLLPANSLNAFSDALTRLVGSALGGMLLSWLGFSFVVFFDAGSFLISALMILFIVMPVRPAFQAKAAHSSTAAVALGVWQDWVAGLKLVRQENLLLSLFIIMGVASLGDSMVTVLIVPLVKVRMGGGPQLLGWLMMAEGIGGLLGGLLVGQFGKRISPRYLATIALVFVGLVIITLVTFPHSLAVFPLMALVGLLAAAWFTSAETLLQMGTSDAFRGRIFGTLGTTLALASLAGMLLAGSLSDLLGLAPILWVSGSIYILSGILAWVLLTKTPQIQTSRYSSTQKDISSLQTPAS